MPVATLTLELAIEHAQSLKDRRQAVRSLKDKLRHGFNVSVAELDERRIGTGLGCEILDSFIESDVVLPES